MDSLGRTEVLILLREFDTLLAESSEITIRGGAAGILCHGFHRGTLDIDLVQSLPALSSMAAARDTVAQRHDLPQNWLNDSAKGFIDYLPDGFRERRIPVEGTFSHLRVFALARVDLLMMKLAAFRPEDIADVLAMGISNDEAAVVRQALEKVATFDAKKAYVISMFLTERGAQ